MGVICGLSGVTVVDIDDASLLSPMIERFGDTPFKIGTPSGGVHLWYRSSGEPSSTLRPGLAVDLKGHGGQVAVPPSVRPSGTYAGHAYKFLAGSWNDLARLPRIRPGAYLVTDVAPARLQAVKQGHRNDVLFRSLLRHAKGCDDIEALYDIAETLNSDFLPPLPTAEIAKTVLSAWEYEATCRNWVRHESRVVTLKSEWEKLRQHRDGSDALLLLEGLRFAHWNHETFAVSAKAMWLAQFVPGWGHQRYRKAITALGETGFLVVIHAGGRGEGDPRLFAFSKPLVQKGTDLVPNITRTPLPLPTEGTGDERRASRAREANLPPSAALAKTAGGRR
jgi:hypothetical protein